MASQARNKPEKLRRPIGVIAPEGKILAGHVRELIKLAMCQALHDKPRFRFVPNRGTEEAISKALSSRSEVCWTELFRQRDSQR